MAGFAHRDGIAAPAEQRWSWLAPKPSRTTMFCRSRATSYLPRTLR